MACSRCRSDRCIPANHAASHLPGGSDPLDYSLINLADILADRPAASPVNAGLFFFATDTGDLYRSDGASWTRVPFGGVELGYAEITSAYQQSTTGTTFVDVPGLSTTVTTGTRPIMVRFEAYCVGANAISSVQVNLIEDGTIITNMLVTANTATVGFYPGIKTRRRAPAPGSHTYKVRLASATAGVKSTIFADATSPSYIQVVEI